MRTPGFGRIPSPPDERDYLMSTILKKVEHIPSARRWTVSRNLNQGSTPHCVGFAWAGWGISDPVRTMYRNSDAHRIYYSAKEFDRQPRQENGSTIRSGAKAMVKRDRIQSYYFASEFRDAHEFVGNHGPVVLGINWHEGMMEPIGKWHIIEPKGKVLGGHAILWYGIQDGLALLHNSWGKEWGLNGCASIQIRDLNKLFNADGEACAAIEKAGFTDKGSTLWEEVKYRMGRQ